MTISSYPKLSLFLAIIISPLLLDMSFSYTIQPSATTFKMSTTTAPTREKTRRETSTRRKVPFDFGTKRKGFGDGDNSDGLSIRGGPLEYLVDDKEISRRDEDPFHILLLGATFDKPKVTVPYVAGSLSYVLDMPDSEATEHAEFAEENGVSCLGTWTHQECLSLGGQLQVRDIVCRVVPYCEGVSSPWQAKFMDAAGSLNDDGGFD